MVVKFPHFNPRPWALFPICPPLMRTTAQVSHLLRVLQLSGPHTEGWKQYRSPWDIVWVLHLIKKNEGVESLTNIRLSMSGHRHPIPNKRIKEQSGQRWGCESSLQQVSKHVAKKKPMANLNCAKSTCPFPKALKSDPCILHMCVQGWLWRWAFHVIAHGLCAEPSWIIKKHIPGNYLIY